MLRTGVKQITCLPTISSGTTYQQTRNAVMLSRMFPLTSYKQAMKNRKFKGIRHNVFIVDEAPKASSKKMEVLLTKDIKDIGVQGAVVSLPKGTVRNRLFPLGLAVYNNPENAEKYPMIAEIVEETIAPETARTLDHLKTMNLPIPMNPEVNWVLDTNHVRLAFRKIGVQVPLHCITIPSFPIAEPQDININLRMNNKYDITVHGIVYHYKKDQKRPDLPRIWTSSKKTLHDVIKAINRDT